MKENLRSGFWWVEGNMCSMQQWEVFPSVSSVCISFVCLLYRACFDKHCIQYTTKQLLQAEECMSVFGFGLVQNVHEYLIITKAT